jgi:hypothetical protein
MGVAWYIVLEKELEGMTTTSIDGKAFARAHEELDRIAAELGLTPPSAFLSQSAAEASAMAEELQLGLEALPPERWFAAEGGFTAVRGILERLRESGDALRVIADLEAMERVLRAAKDAGVRFHFSIDI